MTANPAAGLAGLARTFAPASIARASKLAHALLVVLDDADDEAALLGLAVALADRFRHASRGDLHRRRFDLLVEVGWEAANGGRIAEEQADALLDRTPTGRVFELDGVRWVVLEEAHPEGEGLHRCAPLAADVAAHRTFSVDELEQGREIRVLPTEEAERAAAQVVAMLADVDPTEVEATGTADGFEVVIRDCEFAASADWCEELRRLAATLAPWGRFADVRGIQASTADTLDPPPSDFALGSWWQARPEWGPDAGAFALVQGSLQGGDLLALAVYAAGGYYQTAIKREAFGGGWDRLDEAPSVEELHATTGGKFR
jgi:hypothetical protein